ncbi:MAG: YtxH domain-containing protein [Polyangiaceae bacterium]|nr:YtxH domain-containing protein [Polyangiaceae bacterium]
MDRAIFDEVRSGAETAAETAREKAGDLAEQASKAFGYLRSLPFEQLLWRIGLERRRSRLYGVGLFTAGLACGAVAGALFAPKAGKDLRATLNRSIKKAWGRSVETTKHYEEKGEELWGRVRHHDGGEKGNQPGGGAMS